MRNTVHCVSGSFRILTTPSNLLRSRVRLCLFLVLLVSFPLRSQTDDSRHLYSDTSLVRVDVTIDPARLTWIYANTASDSEHPASVRIRTAWFDETVDSVGFRLRGNTSRDAKKKSFKISFNSFVKGRQFHGVEKLNLNGEHNDPSIIRSKLCFDLYRDIGVPASRANHAMVFINGAYYGLYVSVEHVDENFLHKNFTDDGGAMWKCLYPADLTYLGADPALYKNKMNGANRVYELNDEGPAADYLPLLHLTDILTNTPLAALPDSLDRNVDVRRALQYFAMNTLVGSWDDYRSLMNNYYLYRDPSDGRFTVIPYDYDNTFGVDWFSVNWAAADPYSVPKVAAGARPFFERMLQIDNYRDLYTHFLRFYCDSVVRLPLWEARLQRTKDTITAAALSDPYRVLDYGFNADDFLTSYTAGTYQKLHVKSGIRAFVNTRTATLPVKLTSKNSPGSVYATSRVPIRPTPADSLRITASVFAAAGIKSVRVESNILPLSSIIATPMMFRPVPGSKRVEDADRWTAVLPPVPAGAHVRYRIAVTDSLDRTTTMPRNGFIDVPVSGTPVASVVINEFLADNSTIADPAGQFDDYVELYNPTSDSVPLAGKYLTDKPGSYTKWKFKATAPVLAPGGRVLVWCDEDSAQSGIHTNFKLSASGEFLALTDTNGISVMDSITFGPQTKNISYGRSPDGGAGWGRMTPTPNAVNGAILTSVRSAAVPTDLSLSVFPNPFNPETTVRFAVPRSGQASVTVYSVLGREVQRLFNGAAEAGTTVQLSFRGQALAAGIYFIRLQSVGGTVVRKICLVK